MVVPYVTGFTMVLNKCGTMRYKVPNDRNPAINLYEFNPISFFVEGIIQKRALHLNACVFIEPRGGKPNDTFFS